MAGFIIICFILLITLIGIIYTPYDPNKMNTVIRFMPPSLGHPLGTDNFGRDILSRIMSGSKFTLIVATFTVFIGTVIGSFLGLLAGYVGGIIDEIVMRINDALTSFPGVLLALVLVSVTGQNKYSLIIALGIIFIPSYARIVRSETLRLRNQEFVSSAKLFGASPLRIMLKHILPNVYPSLLPAITIGFSNAILAEASMSYLGFGIQPPDPSLGRMLSEAQSYMISAPWYALAPGIFIILIVFGINLIAEGIGKEL
jgi:peptide/nickel transport system permease protein